MTKRAEYILLGLILLCALAVRLQGALSYYYHTDEFIHSFIAHGSNLVDVFYRGLRECHPPLGHFIRYIFYQFDDSVTGSRLLSIAFGLPAIFVFYLIGKKLSPAQSSRYGLILALLAAFATVSVIYTTSVRNYSFFLLFMALSYYNFVSYAQNLQRKNLLYYAIFSFLACATHFSGFIFTFALSSALLAKNYRKIFALTPYHIPHLLLLGIMFYFYYIESSIGQGWYSFYSKEGSLKVLKEIKLISGFISLYFGFFIFNMSFFVVAFLGSIFGIYKLWQGNKAVALSIIFVLLTQLILAVFHLYPLTGSRYGFYLFPLLILPLGKFIDEIFQLNIFRKIFVPIVCLFVITATIYSLKTDFYFSNSSEFTTTNQSFNSGVDYLKSNLATNDIIITNKGSWLHLLYTQDKANTGYYPEALGQMNFAGHELYFREENNRWEYLDQNRLYELLNEVKPNAQKASGIWFAVFGVSDYSIFTLRNCDYIKPHITNSLLQRGVMIFKIDKEFFLKEFYPPSKEIAQCFANSKELNPGTYFPLNN